ncbi:PDZ domain (Also known as DHR or GLGF) [Aquisphaera giovannonii]|uniref:PDZ domain (Also known as DHR or GLGF) n=1 Tax=Aquisphaera giovannonii TaxID=406548 RepID=A0A5B9WG03_9BACT|nr:PDZ domain-containing protein [Aquisphaera giovannonii]QEH39209.1 PDZ domain (Also known as DHR or GLGF) [Aquisphaera giovannonii]
MRMLPSPSPPPPPSPPRPASRGGLGLGLAFLAALGLGLASHAGFGAGGPGRDPQVGRSFRVPYRLTDTNHFLVRVRINGKGPFNFLVDSGAPALFVATETAAQIGLKPKKGQFWSPVERLDFEGGATLKDVKARVEDPFQLVGMNALGLPGASIHGILGFTILARFRLEIDPSRDRMTWTRLDHDPADPPVPPQDDREGPPAELRAMNAIGPLAKGLAFLMGKQPEEERLPRGFLGLEWSGPEAGGRVRVDRAVEGSPAAKADLRAGDEIVRINGRSVDGLKAAHAATAALRPGDSVSLVVRREGAERTANFKAGEGF